MQQDMVYSDQINVVGESVCTAVENTKVLVTGKESGLEVNAIKTNYRVMSRDKNGGGSQKKKLIIIALKGWKSSNIWEKP